MKSVSTRSDARFLSRKIAFILLGFGLITGLVVPYLLRETTIGAEVQVRFIWSKSPFGTFDISLPVLFGFLGAVFVALAILRFIRAQKRK